MNLVIGRPVVTRQQTQLTLALPAVRLPIYVRLMLMVMTSVVALTVGWLILVRQDVPSANPFASYEPILPGQPRDAVIAMRFSCNPDTSSGKSQYCTRAPGDGPFSLIAVTLSDGVVSQVGFTVRQGALAVSDLAFLWERPLVSLYRQSAIFEWPDMGVDATGWAESNRFSYFVPVLHMAFGPAT
jgi:hypothetical protein